MIYKSMVSEYPVIHQIYFLNTPKLRAENQSEEPLVVESIKSTLGKLGVLCIVHCTIFARPLLCMDDPSMIIEDERFLGLENY